MMKAVTSLKGALLTLISAVVVTAATLTVVYAASGKADFTLAVTPASQEVNQGQAAAYTVTIQSNNGFQGSVSLTSSNLPIGTSASFSPNIIDKSSSPASFVINVGPSTASGSYPSVTVTGTSGSLVHSATVNLKVDPAPQPSYTLTAAPASQTMLPGDTASYGVTVNPANGFNSSVALSVIAGLPAGGTATFTPATTKTTSNLQVATKNNSPTGVYTLTIAGAATGQQQQTTSVTLTLSGTGKSFTISAPAVSGVAPGKAAPINLSINNPNNQPMQVTNLTVALVSVAKGAHAPAGTCSLSDYHVDQFSGAYGFTVPGGGSVSLLGLGFPTSQWPALAMYDSGADQDGCMGASIQLSYSGSGQG